MPLSPMEILLQGNRDEMSMKALSEGLRRKKDISQLSVLSGDPILGRFGQGLGTDVLNQQNLSMRRDEKDAQRALTKGYYDQMAGQFDRTHALAKARAAEQARHNLATEGKFRVAAQKELSKNVNKLSAALTKANVPEIEAGIRAVDQELQPYIESKDVPGVGKLGTFNVFTSDARQMRARIGKIRNIILKARSGGAVTPQEADRLFEEFSLTAFNSDKEFLKSWQDFKNSFEAGVSNILAGYDEDVLSQYADNLSREMPGTLKQPPSGIEMDYEETLQESSAPSNSKIREWGDL